LAGEQAGPDGVDDSGLHDDRGVITARTQSVTRTRVITGSSVGLLPQSADSGKEPVMAAEDERRGVAEAFGLPHA
jgi:hypothetical protein